MFVETILENLPESELKLSVLAFCNPIFLQIARKHADHFRNQLMSIDVDDEDFKLQYKVAKERLAAWQVLLDFAAKHAPIETQWGEQFEVMLTQIGGQPS